MQVNARSPRPETALSTWLAGPAAETGFRRRWLGRAPVVLAPRDRAWREVAPGFAEWTRLARAGLPFQIAAERRYDRSGKVGRLGPALAEGKTVFFPQIHQVLPRLARLMAALRATLLGPGRAECSFLFMVEGRSREGLGLHHDGAVDAFWLQLEGRRTVTIGPPVPPGTPEELPGAYASRRGAAGWRTLDLEPGTLFYMPPRTPHRVICRGRSLAVSLTWGKAVGRRRADRLAEWDVVSGRANGIPRAARGRLWTQVPAVAGAIGRGGRDFALRLPDGAAIRLPIAARALADSLAGMPSWRAPLSPRDRAALAPLIEHGIVAPRDLPLVIAPRAPRKLDGWRFA
jgi:mannose-6-phosphate isomerase-like protein (cupin superfamily)